MPQQKLWVRVVKEIQRRNYSYRTEKSYVSWIKRFVKFNKLRHPQTLAEEEVVAFLNWPAVHRNVAASTQNQALCALVFLCEFGNVPAGLLNDERKVFVSRSLFGFPACLVPYYRRDS